MNLNNNPSSNNYPLIIECCRIDPDSEKLESLARTISDWDSVLSSAYAHGVYPLIAKSLKTINAVPDTIKSDLKQISIHIAQLNMQKSAELIRVVQALEEGGIRVLAIKGPVLSLMAHGNIRDRQYSDLDIMVRYEEIVDAVKILMDSGYTNQLPLRVLENQICLDTIKDFTVVNQHSNISIELHWRLFEKKYAGNGLLNEKNKSQSIEINRFQFQTIEDEMLLVYLCLHGSKHMWERIEWICDIDRLVRNRVYDWEKIDKYSNSIDLSNGIFLGFALARRMFDTPIPKELNCYLNTPVIDNLIMQVMESMERYDFEENFTRNKTIFFFQMQLYTKRREKIKFFLNVIFNISEEDCQTFYLKDEQKWLYLFLRPYRLMKKILRKIIS